MAGFGSFQSAVTLAIGVLLLFSTNKASAATYTIVWSVPDGSPESNYTMNLQMSNVQVGDSLVFQYDPAVHNVLQVSKADYDACNSAAPIKTWPWNAGSTIVPLSAVETLWFICGFPSHCSLGQIVTVNVAPAGVAPAPTMPMPTPGAGSPVPSAQNGSSSGSPTALVAGVPSLLLGAMAIVYIGLASIL